MKVLVSGDVRGRLCDLHARIDKLNASAHGPFDVVFCVGQFFAAEGDDDVKQYVSGEKTFPIPLHFVVSSEAAGAGADVTLLAEGGEICTNLNFLGSSGVRDVLGLTIAYLSGVRAKDSSAPADAAAAVEAPQGADGFYSETALGRLVAPPGAGVDLFLSCEWPQGLHRALPENAARPTCLDPASGRPAATGSPAVSAAVLRLRPRYHFAGLQTVFFQRAPYSNPATMKGESAGPATRFHGLGAVDKAAPKARKWLHALKLAPLDWSSAEAIDAAKAPPGTTPNPFLEPSSAKRAAPLLVGVPPGVNIPMDLPGAAVPPGGGLSFEQIQRLEAADRMTGGQGQQFFYGAKGGGFRCVARGRGVGRGTGRGIGRNIGRGGRTGPPQRRGVPVPVRKDCWFCVASPACEKHLIVSIGEECYLALPKGGVVPEHVLIIPVSHTTCFAAADVCVLAEAERYKEDITKLFASFGAIPLFYERSVIFGQAAQRHAYIEAIPLPAAPDLGIVEKLVYDEATKVGLSFEVLSEERNAGLTALTSDLGNVEDQGRDAQYLYVELPSGKSLVHRVKEDGGHKRPRLPLQFGRHVACRAHGCMERRHWKDCTVSVEKEGEHAGRFKGAFKAFDHTMT